VTNAVSVQATGGGNARRRTRRVGAVAAVAAVLALWPQPARAEYGDVCVDGAPTCVPNPNAWSFYGTITDAVGRPIEGAVVADPYGEHRAYSLADGSYRLDYDGPICCTQGSNDVIVTKVHMIGTTKYGGTVTGEDDRLDATLLYRAQARVTPYTVRPGESPTVTVSARVPAPETACGFVGYYDYGWHVAYDEMVYASTASDGTSTWQLVLPPDLTSPSGYVVAWVEDCESREVLTNYSSNYYDREA